MDEGLASRANRNRNWGRASWWIALSAVIVMGLVLVSPAYVLRGIAQSWIVSDNLEPADTIVVLGGGLDIRPAAAAELYKRGIAPRIAIGMSEFDRGREGGLIRESLLQHGVPSTAIDPFSFGLHSTYGEARGILSWATNSGANSVIIPIDIFSARRVRWIFNHELNAMGMRAIVQAINPSGYTSEDWWRHAAGIRDFRNELIKFAYYRLRY
jgi:DUF218 domain